MPLPPRFNLPPTAPPVGHTEGKKNDNKSVYRGARNKSEEKKQNNEERHGRPE